MKWVSVEWHSGACKQVRINVHQVQGSNPRDYLASTLSTELTGLLTSLSKLGLTPVSIRNLSYNSQKDCDISVNINLATKL